MPTAYLIPYPLLRVMQSGVPVSGAKVYTYEPGTTTPKTTYTSQVGDTPNTNPIICDSNGEAACWVTGNTRLVIRDAADVLIDDVDTLTGVGTPQASAASSEWTASGFTPTYLSSTTFRVAGDRRATFEDNRRLQLTGTPTGYTSVLSTSYDGGGDTTTITTRDAVVPSDVSAVSVGFVTADNSSIDVRGLAGSTEMASVVNNLIATTDPGASNDNTEGYGVTSHWLNTTAGRYFICRDASTGAAVWDRITNLSPGNAAGMMSGAGYPDKDLDSADGVELGTLYLSTDNNDVSVCVDPTAGAAVWRHWSPPDAVSKHEVSAGGHGGDATSGSWQSIAGAQKRNGIAGASVSVFGFSLPAGRYRASAWHTFYQVNGVRLRLRNTTDSSTVEEGSGAFAGSAEGVNGTAFLETEFVLSVSGKTHRVEYQCDQTQASNGQGRAPTFGGTNIFGEVRFVRIGNA